MKLESRKSTVAIVYYGEVPGSLATLIVNWLCFGMHFQEVTQIISFV